MKRHSRRPSAAHDAEPGACPERSRGASPEPSRGNGVPFAFEQDDSFNDEDKAFLPAPPAFTPVPVRHRKDGWTPERQLQYVAALARTGHAGKAARAVGMTEQSAAKLRRRPDAASFDAACAAAFLGARRRWAQARLASKSRRAGRFGIYSPLGSRTL